MISIIVAAKKRDKAFWNKLKEALGGAFSMLSAYERSMTSPGESAELILTDSRSFDSLSTEKALIIFKDTEQVDLELVTEKPVVAVVDSCNKALVPHVSATKLPAVTCGLSPRDTITLSSIGTHSAVVNLQRSIACLDGTVAEPQEIPVKLREPIDSFTLMAVASVFILSGKTEQLVGHSL